MRSTITGAEAPLNVFYRPPWPVEVRIAPMTPRPQIELCPSLQSAALPTILLLATALNGFDLGRLSLWYDEVVTMRLARAHGPAELLRLLGEIDATRAPLHPLLLQQWLNLFGSSELAGRSFSALCGVGTVLLVYKIGRDAYGYSTGLWAAWLATLSPLLVYYSREARMYAWLVLVTCAAWALLLGRLKSLPARLGYIAALVALAYSHPLGLIMTATLALASGLFAREIFGSRSGWLVVHAVAGLLTLPWIRHYLDHSPEHLSGQLPIKFLLGTPIGFIGGNFLSLAGFLVLAGYGVIRHFKEPPDIVARSALAPACLLIWLTLPPTALFAYSLVSHPIFGPARYNLFVAPAYLILVASGLSRLPVLARYPIAIAMAGLSIATMRPMVYDPEIKGDWRAFGASIAAETAPTPTVVVMSADPSHNVEVETARYYLPSDCTIIGSEAAESHDFAGAAPFYLVVGSRRGELVRPVPDKLGPFRFMADRSFPGLAVFRGVRGR